ncbi:type II secretion system F family protein [Desulfovibrio sulfodismutans]|uniref:Type II secretion system F family protein n=1 Tax=Desulfolutivibrio sulfodismutans TaxID=63561 RepID=A0A7K3NJL7_9BACT|nr:type II secretion system F family protein [Desulfolutivibrio sulfodismutans]NDY56394.1 type II secretion system F family protein [Desulfolutivibrio sulfodismutans]QLA13436.1 type II secretion system F family protein [Desulfolutivibrio sulfodismutans DSM 3696]
MAKFAYEAYNDTGSLIQGELEADSGDAATARLAAMGYIPVAVRRGGAAKGDSGEGGLSGLEMALTRVKSQDLILFTKQFRTMLAAGLSILELLRVLEQQTENKKLKMVCAKMGDDMRKGVSISDALGKHPSVFSKLYVSMVKAGELSGMLPEVLDRLIYIVSHENKVKTDIKKALQYPLTVLIALGGAFFFLLTYVVPVFAKMFATAKIELPWPTKVAMNMSTALNSYWYLFLSGLAVVVGGLWLFFRTEQGKVARDAFWLKIPILGSLFVKAAMSRFASIFSILQASGVQVLQALDILSETIGNAAIAKEFGRIKDQIREGRGISGPLQRARYFTPMVVSMVAIGEETGDLDAMLKAVSEHYDDEVGYAVGRLADAIGPILIVGLAGVVGFFALSIFMPMWDMTKMVK